MSQLNSNTATHISPKILCQYLSILVWSGAYAPVRRYPAKTSVKTPFYGIASNALMYTLSHFWRNVRCEHECYFWNKFQKCLLGNIPKPLQNATRAFCKNVVKTGRFFQNFVWQKIFLRRFFVSIRNSLFRKKILRPVFRYVIVNTERNNRPQSGWPPNVCNKPTWICQETR